MRRIMLVGLSVLALGLFALPAGAHAQDTGTCDPNVDANSFIVCSGLLDLGVSVLSPDPSAGDGILAGNVIQIPITALVPIQICNNNVAAGVVAVAVDVLVTGTCSMNDEGVEP